MSYGGFGQKSFGFRSQYGGIGLKNNLSKTRSQFTKSTFGFGKNDDSKFKNQYV